VLGRSLTEIETVTTANARALFGLAP